MCGCELQCLTCHFCEVRAEKFAGTSKIFKEGNVFIGASPGVMKDSSDVLSRASLCGETSSQSTINYGMLPEELHFKG